LRASYDVDLYFVDRVRLLCRIDGHVDPKRVGFRPERFRCEVTEGRASALVELHGELDLATVDEVSVALQALVTTNRSVVVDLRGLRFLDSSGLRLIVETDALARQDGFNFTLVRGPTTVQRLFVLTGLDDHLVFVDAPEDLTPGG
jgi:anti-sigma B factor antagonist